MMFEQWLLKQGITLLPWQKSASSAFFGVLGYPSETYRGKTFLVEKMLEFVNEHSGDMSVADDVRMFIADKCEVVEGQKTAVKAAYGAYLVFCKGNGFRPSSLTDFIKRMRSALPDLENRLCSGCSYWIGIRV